MQNLYLLDCTLRDGGYVNDWEFGSGSIKSIFSRLDNSGVDLIEIGFLDERRPYDENRSIFPDAKSVEPVFYGIQDPKAMICAMIDYGTCSIDKVPPKSESHLDGIRVIFKKHLQDEALSFCQQIKEKGYKLFINPVSVTTFNDDEMISLIEKINKINPYAVTIVDTYGLMHSEKVLRYCKIMDKHLNKGIILGYHAHNNFQLAYSNTIAVMENIKDRDLSIDATLFGMGKSAGNACTELVAMYMNERFGKSYDINQIQEAIDVDITKEFDKKEWGYRPLFYISALNECHPNYVTHLLGKRTLSIKQINEILSEIPKENDKNLLYDKVLCEKLYQEYQNREINDSNAIADLEKDLGKKDIFLLGPGKSIIEYKDVIVSYIQDKKPVVFSVNFLRKEFPVNYVFMGNPKRYSQFFGRIYTEAKNVKLICTSNITKTKEKIDYVVNFSELRTSDNNIYDNPLVLLINLAIKLKVKSITLAGFDGYSDDINECYYSEYTNLLYDKSNVFLRNLALKEFIDSVKNRILINTITPSKYF